MKYFTKNYKLWIFYYIAFYFIIVIFPERPSNIVFWKYYFPFKTIILTMAIWWANAHDELMLVHRGKKFNNKRILVIVFGSSTILIIFAVFLCWLIKEVTGINLSFLIAN